MSIRNRSVSIVLISLIVVACYSCKKSSNTVVTTPSTIYTNIDSMTGFYAGTTSGDSIYTYTDASGKPQQWIHSFSFPDTLTVTSPDTTTIAVSSKYYNTSFSYGDSLSLVFTNVTTDVSYTVTTLQNQISGQTTTFTDSTSGINHVIVKTSNGYMKSVTSNVTLYKR